MKKNLVSIIILALLIVNLVLTCFMMFTFTGAAQKTWTVVSDIAFAMNMAKGGVPGTEAVAEEEKVPIDDLFPYNIAEPMTIPLKREAPDPETGKESPTNYIVLGVSLQLNSKHKEFKKYGEGDLTQYVAMIQDEINKVFGKYTRKEIEAEDQDTMNAIKREILAQIHAIYDSDFIYDISFRDIKYS